MVAMGFRSVHKRTPQTPEWTRIRITRTYITPFGLSVLIRELETQLGFRLFDRTTRHVGLTSFGSELLGVVRQSLEKLDSAGSRIRRSAAAASRS